MQGVEIEEAVIRQSSEHYQSFEQADVEGLFKRFDMLLQVPETLNEQKTEAMTIRKAGGTRSTTAKTKRCYPTTVQKRDGLQSKEAEQNTLSHLDAEFLTSLADDRLWRGMDSMAMRRYQQPTMVTFTI